MSVYELFSRESIFIFVGCLPDYIYYGKSCYYFSKTSLYWEPSRKFCKDHGSDLVIINDATENNLIVQHLKQLTAQHVLPSKLLVCLFDWWYLTPLATIIQLYHGGQFYWRGKPEDPENITNLTNFIT